MADYSIIDMAVKIKKTPINVICYVQSFNLVAIGKENGLVEIYDYSQGMILLAKIFVSNTNPIDGLKFMTFNNNVKLFGISSSKLFEIDVSKNCIKQEIHFMNNMLARSIIQANDKIIIGCDGGYIHVYEYISEIMFLQTFHNAEESILSLGYSKIYKNSIFAGCQGRLYKINMTTMYTDYFDVAKDKGKSRVDFWCMDFVKKYLCTGDSRGIVNIWNAETFGLIQSIRTHNAVILTMTVSNNNSIFISGSDPEIVKLELIGESFTETSRRYGMVGDVRAVCATDNSLICGGLDSNLTVYEINSKLESKTNRFKVIDREPIATEVHFYEPAQTFMVFVEVNNSVRIYEVTKKPLSKTLLRTILPKNNDHFQSWTASKSLEYFAYSTSTETRVLKMRFSLNELNTRVEFKRFNATDFTNDTKAEGPGVSLSPSYMLKFIENRGKTYLISVESFVVVGAGRSIKSDNSKLVIYEMKEDAAYPILKSTILAKEENFFNGVHRLCPSDNGRYIAFSTLDGLLFIYSMKKMDFIKKVSRQQQITGGGGTSTSEVPKVLCMAFNRDCDRLIAIYSNKKVIDIDFGQKLSTKWTNNFNSHLPRKWVDLSPRHVEFTGGEKFIVLTNRKLVVKVDMEMDAVVPTSAPLFCKKSKLKSTQSRGLKTDVLKLQSKIDKMKRIIFFLTEKKEGSGLKQYEKRKIKYQKRLEQIQNLNFDPKVETCFSWNFLKNDTIAWKTFTEENVIITISLEEDENQTNFTYRKKIFGL